MKKYPTKKGEMKMKDLIPNRKLLAVLAVVMFILSALLAVAPVRASPGTLYVDADIARACDGNTPCYTHPQDAVNHANVGDTILVYPGTYSERQYILPKGPHWGPSDQYAPALIVFKNGLTIKATDPDPSKTVIQTTYNFWVNKANGIGGGGSIEHSTGCTWNSVTNAWDDDPATPGDCVRPTYSTAPNGIAVIANDVTIDGFTIISTYGGDPKCPLSYPNTGGVFVGALYAGDKTISGISGTTISNSIIRGYSGVRIWKAPHTTLENNTIDNNIWPPTPTPPYYAWCTAGPTPAQVVVEAWEGWNEGANVGSTYLRAVNNHIIDYKRTSGIAVGGYYNGPVDHSGLYLHDNAIEGAGSAIKLWNSQSGNIEISSNTITDSIGGIDLGSGGVHDSLIDANFMRFANLGPWGHGINGQALSSVTISHNDIQGNPNGWAMAIYDSTTVSILGNVVINNAYGIASVNSKGVVAHCNDIVGNGAGFAPYGPYPAFFNMLGSGDAAQYVVDATLNWWGDATGPYHPTWWMYGAVNVTNPGGKGDKVSDYVLYDPWKGSAKWWKQEAIDELNTLLSTTTGDKDVDHKLNEAIKLIQESLEDKLWVDTIRLDPKHGNKVFDKEKDAVHKLMELIDKKDTPQPVKDACQAVIEKLVKADKILADTAYADAKALPPDPKVSKELAKADKEFAKALEELAKGKFADAIEHYGNAWKHAQEAIEAV